MENVTILSESGIVAVGDAAKKLKVENVKYNFLIEKGKNFEVKNTTEVAEAPEQKPIEATNIETVEEIATPIIEAKEEPVRPIIPETKKVENHVAPNEERGSSDLYTSAVDKMNVLRDKNKMLPENVLAAADSAISRVDSDILAVTKGEEVGACCTKVIELTNEVIQRIKDRIYAKKEEIKDAKDRLVTARSEINAKKSDVKIVESVIEPYNPNTSSVTPILGRGSWQGDEPGDITRGMTAIAEEYTRLVTIVDEMKETIVTEENSADALEEVIRDLTKELSDIIEELSEASVRAKNDIEKAKEVDKTHKTARETREEGNQRADELDAKAEEIESDISCLNTEPVKTQEAVTEEKSDKIRSLAELKQFLLERALINSNNNPTYTEPNPFDRFRNDSRRAA